MATIAEALALAMQYQQAGDLVQAEQMYRQVLQVRPNYPEVHNNLGNLLKQMGMLAEAEASYRETLRLRPDLPEAHHNLALAQAEQGRLEEGLAGFREALRLRPDYPKAHNNLGNVLRQMGRFAEAEDSFREALRLRPDFPEAHNNLGLALAEQGRALAAQARRETATIPPALARAVQYHQAGNLAQADQIYRQILEANPADGNALHLLGMLAQQMGQDEAALDLIQRAVGVLPQVAEFHSNLGNVYKHQWRADEAIACYRKAAALKPESHSIRGNLLLALHYPASYDPESTFVEHLGWAEQFNTSPAVHCPLQPINSDLARPLRIGYVSGDFLEHVMGRFSAAIVAAHDRGQVEVFCYANVPDADAVTQRIKASADHWRSVLGLADAQVAELIRADRIDLLVDLAGHTGGNRLGVFAIKPAPIQVTYGGYPATTGLAAIDYRLTDVHCDPLGRTERWHSEKLVRLPKWHYYFTPPSGPEVGPLPAQQPGAVTFGSFNYLVKVTESMIGLWSRILKNLPGSRLVMLTGAGTAADERVRAAFAQHGIGEERLTLVGRQSPGAYLRLYHGVDLCLDTYPYSGCNTTADALWMGVPVVSLAGASCASRLGVAALVQVGLEDLVTETTEAYVETAIRLARDLSRLQELRGQLRERVERSVGDVRRFCRDLEAAYRTMWERFCRGKLPR